VDASYCDSCGAQASLTTPATASLPQRIQRLIPKEYAERLLSTRGKMQAERRLVTILFSDVKSSSAMTTDLDPEKVMEVMDEALDVLIEPIYRYEGTLARLEGDAVLAFFGAPIAHEDDPERACRAALDIIDAAKQYASRLAQERSIEGFDVRVGISSGLVVTGEVGSDFRVEYTAMGDAIWMARRMQTAAEPGTVLVTEDTHRLVTKLFETEALAPIQVKGKAGEVPIYQVLAARELEGKPRGVEGLESPLVGREDELAALRHAVEDLRAGVGGIVTLVGEAGLGKSRLVAELRKDLPLPESPSQSPLGWLEGRCLSYGKSTAYLPWLDVMRGLLGIAGEHTPSDAGELLCKRLQALCPDNADDVYPYLARLLSLPVRPEEEGALQSLEGESLKAHTFRAIRLLIECTASQQPLVLVCEDLQWADPTSIELLEQTLSLTDRTALLLICVLRPVREHGCWRIREQAARAYSHRHTDIPLGPLAESESEALLSNLLQMKEAVRGFRERVLSHAEGNPFFVEEILRSLIDSGAIVRDQASGDWRATEDLLDMPIPETLQGVLMARIDQLPEGTRSVLQTASVIGRIVPHRLLQAVAGDGPRLTAHLLRLQREQMIRERARLPEVEYIFKHHLTEEAAYQSMLRSQRRLLHRQVAEALEERFSERIEEQLGLLAHHWERAEDLEKAVDYLFQAGERARRLGASVEAIDFHQSALQKATGLKLSEDTVGLGRIHEGLGDVYLLNLSRPSDALHHYESFLGLAAPGEDSARASRKVATVHLVLGDLARARDYYEAALARLSNSPLLAETSRIHYYLAYLFASRNQLDDAEWHANAGLQVSGRIDDTRGLADAYRIKGIIAEHRRDLQLACDCDERSLQLYRQLGDLPRIVAACNNVGDTYRLLGKMDRALERLNEGLELARRIGDTRDEASLLQTKAELLLDRGQSQMALQEAVRAVSAAEESGVASRIVDSRRVLGEACEARGRLDDARCHLERAESLMAETQQFRFGPVIRLGLARVSANQGEFSEARRHLGQALDAAGAEPSDAFMGLLHLTRGHVHSRCGEWKDAVAELEKSLALLVSPGLPVEVGRAHMYLGTAYAHRRHEGDRGRACEHLLAALSIFEGMGAQGYVAHLQMQLGKVGCLP
jgi:class 3 adenylate cyclase/tetratricopeptide (TPR) repeat protein